MRSTYIIIVVGLLLCCGCQSTTPAKIDNPVVGPPPPRLPADQIRARQLAYAGQSDDGRRAKVDGGERYALNSDSDEAVPDHRPSGIQTVSLEQTKDEDLPTFEDGMVVAFVNDQPIFAGEVLAPAQMKLKAMEAQMRKEYGKQFKPEMTYRLRGMFIKASLPHLVDTKMLALAAKTEFKKNQLEGLNKALEKEWVQHLEQMMEANKCNSLTELQALMEEKDYDLEEHETAFKENQLAINFVSYKAHSKFEPTRKEMLTYYEAHIKDYEFPSRVHWQQLVISDAVHKGEAGAKRQVEKAVEELLADAEFGAVVKKYGDGPKTANGGVWDWTIKGSLQNKEIEKELFTLPVGEMSGVIRTPTGFQIVQVLDRQEAGCKSFESLQKTIEEDIKREAYSTRAKEVIHQIRENTIIKTVFDEAPAGEKPEGPIKKVSVTDEQPTRTVKQAAGTKEPAAKAGVSRASVSGAPVAEDRQDPKRPWKNMFRQKPAIADDDGEMNNVSD